MDTVTAPDLTPGYPSKGSKLGPAWRDAWAELVSHPTEWLDSRVLAGELAPKHGLAVTTVVALLTRMATGGMMDRTYKVVQTQRGPRTRAHYRAKP